MARFGISFKLLREGSVLPKRSTSHSGAFDLFAPEAGDLWPGEIKTIGLGIAHEVHTGDLLLAKHPRTPLPTVHLEHEGPIHFQGLLFGRSGLATKRHIRPFYAPCLIDADYRGEIFVTLENAGTTHWHYKQGDRIAQIMYVPAYFGNLSEAEALSETERGDGGFGHTGE